MLYRSQNKSTRLTRENGFARMKRHVLLQYFFASHVFEFDKREEKANGFFFFLTQNFVFQSLVAHCKERWRNLRACLTRHLKQQQASTEDGSINHKPYYLAEHMSFLLPYTKSRSVKEQIKYETPALEEHKPTTSTKISKVTAAGGTTTTTYTISTAESDENQYVTLIQSSTGELTPADALDETHLQVETQAETEVKPISEQSFTTANAIVSPKEHLQEIIYEPVPAKRIKVSQESDEADLDFFRSLLPDTRLMTASQKRRFKMGIFGLIDNVLTNNDINNS